MALNFGENTTIKHMAGGEEREFSPISVGMMFKMKSLAKPVAKAIGVLTSGGATDTGSIFREVGQPILDDKGQPYTVSRKDGSEVLVRDSENIAEAITPELAAMRSQERADAIQDILDALTSDANQRTITEIILNSLGETETSAQEFMANCPAPAYIEFVIGVCKANKGVFGPLAERLGPLWSRLAKKLPERDDAENGKNEGGEESGRSEKHLTLSETGETSPTM